MRRLIAALLVTCLWGCERTYDLQTEKLRLEREYADVVLWLNRFRQEEGRYPSVQEFPAKYHTRIARDPLKGQYLPFGKEAVIRFGKSDTILASNFAITWFSEHDEWKIIQS